MKKIKLAILLGNRGFFPGSVIATAREEMCEALSKYLGYTEVKLS